MNNFYQGYLYSDHWRQFRQIALDHYGKVCADCGKKSSLHVHHLTYENLGNELLKDVVVLCKDCHHKRHFNQCEHKNLTRSTIESGGEVRFWWYCQDCRSIVKKRIPTKKEAERAEKIKAKHEKWLIKQSEEQALKKSKKKPKKPAPKKKKRKGHTPEYWEKRRAAKCE